MLKTDWLLRAAVEHHADLPEHNGRKRHGGGLLVDKAGGRQRHHAGQPLSRFT